MAKNIHHRRNRTNSYPRKTSPCLCWCL